MSKLAVVIAFVLFYVFAVASDGLTARRKRDFLLLACMVLAVLAGIRNPELWADTPGYLMDFELANNLADFSWTDTIYGYAETGYHFLVVLIKTVTDNPSVYFIVISALTFIFIYKIMERFSPLPLVGLAVYIARFLIGRNMMQIRAGLSIAIVIAFSYYVTKRKLWQYLLVVLLAYQLHHSALLAIPVLLLYRYRIPRRYIYLGLLLSLFVAQFLGAAVRNVVQGSDFVMEMASSYVEEGSEKAWSNDLSNPMIWFQMALLVLFTINERKLAVMTEHYYLIRNAYFYSTVLLIVLCQFAVVAGRTSTLFATYEVAIIPLLIKTFRVNNRFAAYLVVGIGLTAFFVLNFRPAQIWVD